MLEDFLLGAVVLGLEEESASGPASFVEPCAIEDRS
jgi:hypothetical protein